MFCFTRRRVGQFPQQLCHSIDRQTADMTFCAFFGDVLVHLTVSYATCQIPKLKNKTGSHIMLTHEKVMTGSAWFCKKLKICVFYFAVNVYTTVYSLETVLHIILHISCKMEVWGVGKQQWNWNACISMCQPTYAYLATKGTL